MAEIIRVRSGILARMMEEARRDPHLECCGLLGGRGALISEIFPIGNALASATAFEIAPGELFRFFRGIREAGLEHLGIYHSHPVGENAPSPRDIEQAFYPDVAYFILSPLPGAPRPVRAFSIREARVAELLIESVR
ncbi:MAG TPA: M67 family metallopeptidase [Candidatus Acidoferrales bacterium]|jgi:proteasome lid subunit RPN8/RPN11|nr:M67 family metallopeptidase [Candidatus Acidoferrales bacterium]